MKQYGSYCLIQSNKSFAVGYNQFTTIQPYVTWSFDGEDVTNAVFHTTREGAYRDFVGRTKRHEIQSTNQSSDV